MVGAVGAGAGVGAGFFFLFAGVVFFIPFFLRTGAPRFAFLDFFAMFNLPIGLTKIMQHGITPWSPIVACAHSTRPGRPMRPNLYQWQLKPKTTIAI